ncbi:MAG: aminoacyl-tRNA hydrolase [Solirubrobacteraceae bacterium]
MPSLRRLGAPVDWLIVGLGNPGAQYDGTPHNIGFEVADRLISRWGFAKPKPRYRGLLTDGTVVLAAAGQATGAPSRLHVAVLKPQTYMNEAGRSVGPARGALQVLTDHVIVVHDEIDLPFAEIRSRKGGGLAGHNGLKSLKAQLGTAEFLRVRVGVGRPSTTDPDRVAAFVLGKLQQSSDEVQAVIEEAADQVELLLS